MYAKFCILSLIYMRVREVGKMETRGMYVEATTLSFFKMTKILSLNEMKNIPEYFNVL